MLKEIKTTGIKISIHLRNLAIRLDDKSNWLQLRVQSSSIAGFALLN